MRALLGPRTPRSGGIKAEFLKYEIAFSLFIGLKEDIYRQFKKIQKSPEDFPNEARGVV
jgi:hypothetical protein